jgi:hypothetical protein
MAQSDRDAPATAPSYRLTFGHYTQAGPWTDVRALPWGDLAKLLTAHAVGAKAGTCIVPAVFTGVRRSKADAAQIDVAVLDCDTGHTLKEITQAVSARGWAASISSTHSHGTTRTEVLRREYEVFAAAAGHDDAPARYLRQKGYQPGVYAGARVVEQDEQHVILEHSPCAKFRVVIPLLEPWRAADYASQDVANAAWKEQIDALAAALGLQHDQACTDTSRLFYLPRRPADGPPAETAVLDGALCDLSALPAAQVPAEVTTSKPVRQRDDTTTDHVDPDTGEVHDLSAWARDYAGRFEIAKALQARRPKAFVGNVVDDCKHHIRCPNEDAHTDQGADRATFVINASQSNTKGFVTHCRHGHCGEQDRLFFLRRMLERRWLSIADLTDAEFLTGEPPTKPTIRFTPGDLPQVIDQAEQALLDADLGLYQRGGQIVRVGVVPICVDENRSVTVRRILPVGEHAMVEALTSAAAWEKFDGRSKTWIATDAPLKAASTYLDRVGRWRLPVLTGVITAPTLRPDGSILDQPGYDRATGLLYLPANDDFPVLLQQPTKQDAREALGTLHALIDSFPFVDGPSRSVALSAILTACIRRSLPTAPMHAFSAPTAGSGKSFLVDVASMIAAGRQAAVIAQGKTQEELEKRLGSLLLAGDQVIAIDNCEDALGGDFLCALLTQPFVRARILGRSESPEVPTNAFVTATGNNLVLLGDMTRRAVLCRLDPKEERPELRRFESNPLTAVQTERGRFVAAALTLLRAYHVAGRPAPPDPLGSFEAWSDWVRGALLWLGLPDPVITIETARALDPKLATLTAVVSQWWSVFRDRPVTARTLIEAADRMQPGPPGPSTEARSPYLYPDLREALMGVAGDGGSINSKRLGKWLAANEGKFVAGVRLARTTMASGVARWQLIPNGTAPVEETK